MGYRVAVLTWLCLGAIATTGSGLDVAKIVQRSARVTDADREAAPKYDYKETDREADGSSKTYSVYMLFGSPYRELIAVDGKPLPEDRQVQETRKLAQETERRRTESPQDRERRVAEFQKEQNRDRRFMQELVHAFNFKLLDQAQIDNRQVYVIQATPRAGYHPTDNASKVLKGMRGQLWIDKQTFQWVKVEAKVIHPVSIEGFLAKVEPGTRFELEKMPAADDVWLPKHFSMTSKAEILSVIQHGEHADETYFDYHPAAIQ